MEKKSIAIDGPAGAGKSTLARQLARALGFLYVDTGAIYRTVALAVLRAGIATEDVGKVSQLLGTLDIRMDYGQDGEQRMFLSGEDVSKAIREHQVSGLASKVSAIPAVRDFWSFISGDSRRSLTRSCGISYSGMNRMSSVPSPPCGGQRMRPCWTRPS